MSDEKTRENRARRMARRQGLDLQKSRRRDPQALDYGGYQLIERASSSLVLGELGGHGFGANLDDIETFLLRPRADRLPMHAASNSKGSAEVLVERVPIPDWASDLLLQRPEQADVLILPQRMRDGRGEYAIDDLVGVKKLRAVGVRADWAHAEPDDRTFVSEYSADVPVFVTLFVVQALAQEGVVEVTRWLLGRVRQALTGRTTHGAATPVVIEVDRVELKGNRRVIEGLRVTGHDEGVVEVVKTLLQGGPAIR